MNEKDLVSPQFLDDTKAVAFTVLSAKNGSSWLRSSTNATSQKFRAIRRYSLYTQRLSGISRLVWAHYSAREARLSSSQFYKDSVLNKTHGVLSLSSLKTGLITGWAQNASPCKCMKLITTQLKAANKQSQRFIWLI